MLGIVNRVFLSLYYCLGGDFFFLVLCIVDFLIAAAFFLNRILLHTGVLKEPPTNQLNALNENNLIVSICV